LVEGYVLIYKDVAATLLIGRRICFNLQRCRSYAAKTEKLICLQPCAAVRINQVKAI
jgi:hypothetical protein